MPGIALLRLPKSRELNYPGALAHGSAFTQRLPKNVQSVLVLKTHSLFCTKGCNSTSAILIEALKNKHWGNYTQKFG